MEKEMGKKARGLVSQNLGRPAAGVDLLSAADGPAAVGVWPSRTAVPHNPPLLSSRLPDGTCSHNSRWPTLDQGKTRLREGLVMFARPTGAVASLESVENGIS